jgi:hypothetical protein
VAEFGDLPQLVTANLAARYHDPVTVGVGARSGCGPLVAWPLSVPTVAAGDAVPLDHPHRSVQTSVRKRRCTALGEPWKNAWDSSDRESIAGTAT